MLSDLMRSPLLPALILALSGACGSTCEVDTALDYGQDDLWLCRPGVGPCEQPVTMHALDADGAVAARTTEPAEDPGLACFVVYPTVDLRIGTGLHHQIAQVDAPRNWISGPPRLLSEVCEVWAPVYRQVTIGTYAGQETDRKDRCFDSAYGDVEAAFRAFLAANPDRPFAVFGHSQGGQHLSHLLANQVETDPTLLDRLVVAWPLGWSLGTAAGETTGGSFDRLPVCSEPAQTGCVMGYRSFYKGDSLPSLGRFAEGDEQICTHPASPDDERPAPLSAFTSRAKDSFVSRPASLSQIADDDLIQWPGAMEAACVGDPDQRALQVVWTRSGGPPFNPDGLLLSGDNGTHVLDVQIGIADLVDDIRHRAAAWAASGD